MSFVNNIVNCFIMHKKKLTLGFYTFSFFFINMSEEIVCVGQGTMGLEILDQVPDLDAIVIPVGGGGLIAGHIQGN